MGRDINRVILLGNLVNEPQVKYSEAGHGICYFDIGVSNNARMEEKRQSCYVRVIVVGKYIEACQQRLHKGLRVLIEGKLRNYTKEKGDISFKTVEVLADSINTIGSTKGLEEEQTETEQQPS